MRRKNGKFASILAACFLISGLVACTGAAGPPAPLVEIPSSVTFPTSLDIDVDTVATTQTPVNIKALVGSGPFTSLIVVGAELARTTFNLFVKLALRPLNPLQIPASPDIVHFEISVAEGNAAGDFKIDFSDYDFNGDGAGEGCTGCTCPTRCDLNACPSTASEADLKPVCYRVWFRPQGETDFTRFIAGVFTRLPVPDDPETSDNEENPGNGQFRRATFELSPDEPSQLGAIYQHRDAVDPRNKATQVALRNEFSFEDGKNVSFTNIDVTQVGLDNPLDPNNLLKTIRATTESTDETGKTSALKYRGRFREDADFFSGKVLNPGGEVPLFCAQISTGDAAEIPSICNDLGISVEDLEILPVAGAIDVDLPADFPLAPTF